MKKSHRAVIVLLPVLIFAFVLLAAPQPVFASSDAVQDIMNHDRFEGAIETIEFITKRIDFWFTALITATAFFIISAALLKNACAGAYVANQKFWDEVAKAHEARDAQSIIQNIQGLSGIFNEPGGIRNFLLCIVPNIKAFTDFDDAPLEPKAYFAKAIPQMLACIIIGVFIYNGYYRDTAATVGAFGSEVCNRIFASVDPVTFVDKITQTEKNAESIYANDPTLQGEAIFAVSKEVYKTFLSESKEMTSIDAKTSLMRDSERIVYDIMTESRISETFFSDGRKYDFTVTNIKVSAVPKDSTASKVGKVKFTAIDNQTQSKYSVKAFQVAPNSAVSYLPDDKKYCYISFVFNGKQRSDKKGTTSVVAEAGSWGSSTAATKSMDYKVPSDNQTKQNGSVTFKGTVPCKDIVKVSDVASDVKTVIESRGTTHDADGGNSNFTVDTNSIKILSFNNNGGIGDNVTLTGKAPGDVIDFSVRCEAKYTDNTTKETVTTTVTVPVSVTLKQ